MTWQALIRDAAVVIALLVPAVWLLRSARRRAHLLPMRPTILVRPSADWQRCAFGGGHMVGKSRAVRHGTAYDGTPIYICRRHLADAKRLRVMDRESA